LAPHDPGFFGGSDGADFIVAKHWDSQSYLFFEGFGMGRRSGELTSDILAGFLVQAKPENGG
jgi:hypothetical protein